MNATERARRSDSLYYDTQVTNRRALCDMIANLESDLTESKAENAKLRELVRIAGTYCVNGLCGKDDGCPLYLGKPYCALPDRMRELGVDDG